MVDTNLPPHVLVLVRVGESRPERSARLRRAALATSTVPAAVISGLEYSSGLGGSIAAAASRPRPKHAAGTSSTRCWVCWGVVESGNYFGCVTSRRCTLQAMCNFRALRRGVVAIRARVDGGHLMEVDRVCATRAAGGVAMRPAAVCMAPMCSRACIRFCST